MEIGDVVQLNSGGPDMTVIDKTTNLQNKTWCSCSYLYYDEDKKLYEKHSHDFPEKCLRSVNTDKK
jgi:uncharacterized protein YodC (DUF2158 family)